MPLSTATVYDLASSRYGTSRFGGGLEPAAQMADVQCDAGRHVQVDVVHLDLDRLAHRFNASAAEQRRGQHRDADDTHAVATCRIPAIRRHAARSVTSYLRPS